MGHGLVLGPCKCLQHSYGLWKSVLSISGLWLCLILGFTKGRMEAGDGWVALDGSGSIQEPVSVVTGWYCVGMIINSNYQQGLTQINLHMAGRHKRSQHNHRYTEVPTLSTCWHRACRFLILLWEHIIWFMCERSVREEYKSHFCSAFRAGWAC